MDAPLLQGADGCGDVAAEIGRRDGKPFSGVAVEHGTIEMALGGGEENVVQGGESHQSNGC